MSREEVQIAINEGIPFSIRMADGQRYDVTDRFQIAVGKRAVVVIDKKGLPHFLPLLTITGISYRNERK